MKTTTVLVVEDDNSIRNLIGTTLKSHDYQYLMAVMEKMQFSKHRRTIQMSCF